MVTSCASGPPGTGSVTQSERSTPGWNGTGPLPNPPALPSYPQGSIVRSNLRVPLAGSGAVSDTGAANYTLPLWIPEGPLGTEPALSIAYRGGGGNGPLGSGMSLAGLSAIAPCRLTFASDGRADGVDYDADDSYCLDGVKLVEVDDPYYSGAGTDRVYHTERETFARVVAQFDAGKPQPIRFIVHDRDGTTRTYPARYAPQFVGVSDTTFQLDPDPRRRVAFAYPIARTEDPSGNRIEYAYETTDATGFGEVAYRLKTIGYSYGSGTTPNRRVELIYESRPDNVVRYNRGVKQVTRSRVKAIQMYAPNPTSTAQVWSYELRYVTSLDTHDSLLTSVELCTSNGSCSYVRHFQWTKAHDQPTEAVPTDELVEFNQGSLSMSADYWNAYFAPGATHNWVPSTDVRLVVLDADNDGDDDVLYRTQPTIVEASVVGPYGLPVPAFQCYMGTIRLRLSDQGTLGPAMDAGLEEEPGLGASGCAGSTELYPFTYMWTANLGKSRFADFDGDGALELRLAKTYLTSPPPVFDLADQSANAGLWKYTYETIAFDPTIDPDDGLPGRWHVSGNPPDDADVIMHGPIARATWSSGWLNQRLLLEPVFQQVLADVDGDARLESIDAVHSNLDILDYQDVDWNQPFSVHAGDFPYTVTPSTTGVETPLNHHWVCGNGRARTVDVQGDGRDDLLLTNEVLDAGRYTRVGLDDSGAVQSGDTSLVWAGDCSPEPFDNPDLVTGDWNGDGLADILYPPGSYYNNGNPLVRMNLGNGFGPFETMLVQSVQPAVTAADLQQIAPTGRDGNPVPWDRGTRTADLNKDGRTDLLVFREDTAACIDAPVALFGAGLPYSFDCAVHVYAFLSAGDHFIGQELFPYGNSPPVWTGASLANGFTTAQIGDVTGDGAIDVITVNQGHLAVTELPWRVVPDRLAKVTDDSTPFPLETFEYSRRWWGNGDKPAPRDGGCDYPLACSRRGSPVVRTHRVFAGTDANGDAMTRTFLHSFEGPWSDQRGRGALGVEVHRIWDRELGIETIRRFDNTTPLDPDPAVAGGEFYPRAHAPSSVVTVTPRKLLPVPLEIAGASAAPGLSGIVPARVTRTDSSNAGVASANGRILTVLPGTTTRRTTDRDVMLDLTGEVPTYDNTELVGEVIEQTTSVVYDDYGNPLTVATTTPGGGLHHTHTIYSNDLANWRLGRPTRVAVEVADADDGAPPVRIARTHYDALGRPDAVDVSALPAGSCAHDADCPALEQKATHQTMVYDARGNVAAIATTAGDAPTPRTVTFQYDTEGVYLSRTTDALGFTDVALHHPALGVPILSEDAIGIQATAIYDAFGRIVSRTRPGTPTRTWTYSPYAEVDRRGYEIVVASTDGSQSWRRFDERGRDLESASRGFDGAWITTVREYDPFGNVVLAGRPASTPDLSLPSRSRYDRIGRLVSHERADYAVTSVVYPTFDPAALALGKLETTFTDPEGHQSFTAVDIDGRVIRSGHRVGGADYGTVSFDYGPFDQVVRVIDSEGNVTRHAYDALGRRTHLIDPDAGASDFTYDGYGELLSSTNAEGITRTNKYDVLGRLFESSSPDGTLTRTFGTTGSARRRLVQATSPDGVTDTIGYDALGRPTSLIQTIGSTSHRVDQIYDGFGRLALRFYPDAPGYPRFATYTQWNPWGYVSSIDDVSGCNLAVGPATLPASCTNHPSIWKVESRNLDSALTMATFGDGFVEHRDYDDVTGRIEKIQLLDGLDTVDSFTYQYLDDGLLSRRTHGDRVETFEHDELHRLTTWNILGKDGTPPVAETSYAYDELGNLLDVKRGGDLVWAGIYNSAAPHALAYAQTFAPLHTTTVKYDDAGREVTSGARETTWNADDLPSEIAHGTDVERFQYGPSQERVVAEAADETVTYVGKLYEHHVDASLAVRHRFFVHADTGVVAQMNYAEGAAKLRYVVNDRLGSAAIIHDVTGVVETSDFAPFGPRVDAAGAPAVDPDPVTAFGFTGHEDDRGGLVNMNGRIFDPAQYRFLSPDPVIGRPLFGQSHNPYSYVMNSPLAYTDPTGFTGEEEGDDVLFRWGSDTGGGEGGPSYPHEDHDQYSNANQGCTNESNCSVDGLGDTVLPDNSPAGYSDDGYARPGDLSGFRFPSHDQQFDEGGAPPAYYSGDNLGPCGVGCDQGDPMIKTVAYLIAAKFIGPVWMSRIALLEMTTVGGHDDPRFAMLIMESLSGGASRGVVQSPKAPTVVVPPTPSAPVLRSQQTWLKTKLAMADTDQITVGDFYNQVGISSKAPRYYSVPNTAGGRVWVSKPEIDQRDFEKLVDSNVDGGVTIITGTHGDEFGGLLRDKRLYREDVTKFGSMPNVTVCDIFTMSPAQLSNAVNSKGRVICAWCMSEASEDVLRALGL